MEAGASRDGSVANPGWRRIRRVWFWSVIAVGLAMGFGFALFRGGRTQSEPVHGGRSYSEWLERAPGNRVENQEAQAALQAIGVEALPFLLEELAAKDEGLPGLTARWMRGFRWISIGLSPWWEDAAARRYRGRLGLSHLISRNIDLHPALFRLLEAGGEPSAWVVQSVDETLVDRELADPRFWEGLRRLRVHPDTGVRRRAQDFLMAGFSVGSVGDLEGLRATLRQPLLPGSRRAWVALEGLGVPPDVAEAMIRDGLRDPSAVIRSRAAWAAAWRGTNAIGLVPWLEAAVAREIAMPRDRGLTNAVPEAAREMGRALAGLRAKLGR